MTPENYSITADGVKGRITLFLENTNIKIEATAEEFPKAVVTGGITNDLIIAMNKEKEAVANKYGLDS